MLYLYRWLAFLSGIVIFTFITYGQEISQDEIQDVYYTIRYENVVNTTVTAIYIGDEFYIPISEIFTAIRINHKLDLANNNITGFYIHPDSTYKINLNTLTAKIGTRSVKLNNKNILKYGFDIYLQPAFFDSLFNLKMINDKSQLMVLIESNTKLPIFKEQQRLLKRTSSRTYKAKTIDYPILFPKTQSILNGAVADYNVSASRIMGENIFNYDFTIGAEVLTGDFQFGRNGYFSKSISNHNTSSILWRKIFDNNYLSQIFAGRISSNGISQIGYDGIQITNETVQPRIQQSILSINENIGPFWEVEFYANDEFVDVYKADSLGNYSANFILPYGTTIITKNKYGKMGEAFTQNIRYEIPYKFLPSGEFIYTVGTGKQLFYNYTTAYANCAFGINDFITNKIGIDYIANPLYNHILFYNSTYLRVFDKYLIYTDIVPSAFYKTSAQATFYSQASWELSYTKFENNPLYNKSNAKENVYGNLFLPFYLENIPIQFRLLVNNNRYNFSKNNLLSLNLNATIGPLNTSVGFQKYSQQFGNTKYTSNNISNICSYYFYQQKGILKHINGTMIKTSINFNTDTKLLDKIRFDAFKNVSGQGRLQLFFEKNYLYNLNTIGLNLSFQLQTTRLSTAYQNNNYGSTFVQSASGSIGYDSHVNNFIYSSRDWVGQSAASVIMFLDENQDGIFNAGEQIIPSASFNVDGTVSIQTDKNGVKRGFNLLPYTKYNLEINESSIANPMWTPAYTKMAFVTDANSFKPIYIPFFVGAIAEGSVSIVTTDNTMQPVASIKIHFTRDKDGFTKTTMAYGDGTFYLQGLPPGKYTVTLDSTQLNILNVIATPEKQEIEIRALAEGDFVSDINFVLKSKN